MFKFIKNRKEEKEKRLQAQKQLVEEIKSKAIRESTDSLVKGITGALTIFSKDITIGYTKEFQELKKALAVKVLPTSNQISIFAFYFMKISEVPNGKFVLIQVMAANDIDAIEKTKEILIKDGNNPAEWFAVATNRIDINLGDKKVETGDKPKEPIILPIESYITSLLYARDKYAETPHEKGIVTKIINNIKTKHAISS